MFCLSAGSLLKLLSIFAHLMCTLSSSNIISLHACVRFNPPQHIIRILLDLVPESSRSVDCLQRTPLHVAAGTRCSLATIKLLSQSYPAAAAIRDEDGKTPLHLACDSDCELFEGDRDYTRSPPSYEVVATLIKANPNSVPVEDQDGMSALEHAIFSNAPIKVVKLLQYATRKQNERDMIRRRRVCQDSMDTTPAIESELNMSLTSLTRIVSGSSSKENQVEATRMSIAQESGSQDMKKSHPATDVVPARRGEFGARRRGGVKSVNGMI